MFSAFEWMMALRYLRARRQEGFISVIAWFSLLGIMLGVATLIIVMSVMNGFRQELLTRILGVNGHLSVYSDSEKLTNYDALALRVQKIDGVVKVTPMIEGQVMASANGQAKGAVVRGLRRADVQQRTILAENIQQGSITVEGQEVNDPALDKLELRKKARELEEKEKKIELEKLALVL